MINLAAPLGITVSADCSQRLQVSKMFFFSSFASLAVFMRLRLIKTPVQKQIFVILPL